MPLYHTLNLSHDALFQCNISLCLERRVKHILCHPFRLEHCEYRCYNVPTTAPLHITVYSLYLANGGTLILFHCAECSFSISHLSFVSVHWESIAKNLFQYECPLTSIPNRALSSCMGQQPVKVNPEEDVTNCFFQSPPLSAYADKNCTFDEFHP